MLDKATCQAKSAHVSGLQELFPLVQPLFADKTIIKYKHNYKKTKRLFLELRLFSSHMNII